MPSYTVARTIDEAVAALAGNPTVLAGGTDLYPAAGRAGLSAELLDISRLDDLRGIDVSPAGTRIGAATTWSQLAAADLPADLAALRQAALQIGAVQVQNTGTIAGNLCTASPAGDSIPVLLALDAIVELRGLTGARQLPIAEFNLGYRQTARRPDELVVAVFVPAAPAGKRRSAFVKLGTRSHLVISLVMVAAALTVDEAGTVVTDARVAVGACSPVARRLVELEQQLVGTAPGTAPVLSPAMFEALRPIDDVRASGSYRRRVVGELVRRAIAASTPVAP